MCTIHFELNMKISWQQQEQHTKFAEATQAEVEEENKQNIGWISELHILYICVCVCTSIKNVGLFWLSGIPPQKMRPKDL